MKNFIRSKNYEFARKFLFNTKGPLILKPINPELIKSIELAKSDTEDKSHQLDAIAYALRYIPSILPATDKPQETSQASSSYTFQS